MRRFKLFLVAFFCVFSLVLVGAGPGELSMNEVEAEDSYYNISYNPTFGMYQADFYGTSKDVLSWCMFDMYCNCGGGGIIILNNDIWVTSHIDISCGNFWIYGNGHSMYNMTSTYIYVALDNILKVRGNANVEVNNVVFNGYGLCYNSGGLPGSIIELTSGNPTLTLNSCIVCNAKNMTAFDRNRPLGGGTGINAWYGNLVCNKTSFSNISGASIYESEGGNPYNNGRCNVTLNNCSGYNVSGLFSSGESVGCAHNLTINGGDYKCGGINEYVTYCLGIELGNSIDNITSSINNACIKCDGGLSILNNGTMNINNSDISSNYIYGTVSNYKRMDIKGGKIHDSFIGIYNSGDLSIVDGSICNNYLFGIYNEGNVIQSGGNIHSNGGNTPEGGIGGIYQKGKYYIKDNARISSNNSVLLEGQHILDVDYKYMGIDSKSTLTNYTPIVLTVDNSERYVGRRLVNVVNNPSNYSDKYKDLFTLAFSNPLYNNSKTRFDGVKNSASVRAGNNIFGLDANSLYLSGRYHLFYDNSFSGYDKTKVNYSRTHDEFYWKENADIDFASLSYNVTCDGNDVTNSFMLTGMSIDGVTYPILNTHFTDREKWCQNRSCKGEYDVRFNLDFNGNGGKTIEGVDTLTDYNVSSNYTFPEYVFIKEPITSTRQSLLDGSDKTNEYLYSQQGWSIRPDAIYKDTDNIRSNTNISEVNSNLTDYLLHSLENGNAKVKEGIATITYYSVWDEYPVIDNIDIAIPIEDIDEVDEAYLVSRAKVESLDKEDNKDVALSIEGFNIDELRSLDVGEAITINITSTDAVGNTSYTPLTIRISSNKPLSRRTTIRYVDLSDIYKPEQDGGLMENSKWFHILSEEL